MLTEQEFLVLVRDDLRLPLRDPAASAGLDQAVNWPSIHLVRLLVGMEARTGRRVPMERLFEHSTLQGFYDLFAGADSAGHPR